MWITVSTTEYVTSSTGLAFTKPSNLLLDDVIIVSVALTSGTRSVATTSALTPIGSSFLSGGPTFKISLYRTVVDQSFLDLPPSTSFNFLINKSGPTSLHVMLFRQG